MPLVLAGELPLPLDRTAEVPLAVQLADGLRAAATDGLLRAGDRLPATRALAAALGCSRTVTAACYEALQAEGWIAGRHGSGTFVVAIPGSVPSPAIEPPAGPADRPWLDLRPGTPWPTGLARADWRRAWRAAAETPPLLKPVPEGLSEYRAAVGDHLLRHRGLAVAATSVLATAGTTAALGEVVIAWLHPGDTVAVEEPGYPRAKAMLQAAGMRVVAVPVDAGGLDVSALPGEARAVYTTPAHQFPLGTRLAAPRRVALIDWARAHDALVIEDDYDGEVRHEGPPLPLLAALGPDVVVHLGTTSKILTPTLGTGWMVAPPAVHRTVCHHRETAGTTPAPAGQQILVALASDGGLSRHLRRLRRELRARRDLLTHALHTAGITVLGDQAGAHLIAELPSAAAEDDLVADATRQGIAVDRLARCYLGPPGKYGIILGYAAPADRTHITGKMPLLVELITRTSARSRPSASPSPSPRPRNPTPR
jgi:GntR family transcriptional regulator / MocR family aminotransferase